MTDNMSDKKFPMALLKRERRKIRKSVLHVGNHGNYSDRLRGRSLSLSVSFLTEELAPILNFELAKKPPTSVEHFQHICTHHTD